MAISVVTSFGNPTTSPGIDSSGANLLIAPNAISEASYGTTSDNKSNPYTNLTKYGGGSPYHTYQTYCEEADIAAVGSGHTASNSFAAARVGLIAVTGADPTPFDNESGADSNSVTSIQPGSITPSVDGCLLVSTLQAASAGAITAPAGWTVVGNDSGLGAIAYLIQGTAAAVNPTWTTASAGWLAASMSVWKPAAGGGGSSNGAARHYYAQL